MTFPIKKYRIKQLDVNSASIAPFEGESFSSNDHKNIKNWANENEFVYSQSILYGVIENIPNCSYLTIADRKSIQLQLDRIKQLDTKDKNDITVYINSDSFDWIESQFPYLGNHNKAKLSEFLDGSKEFDGLFDRSCLDKLVELELFSYGINISHSELSSKVKNAYLSTCNILPI